jgi:Domain of unknown function (DUF5615)
MAQRIKFYTDEHVSKAVIRALRKRGVDVLSSPEAGLLSATDEEHLEKAASKEECCSLRTMISFACMPRE